MSLGRVFVANMTGNVVFVGFVVAGAPGFSLLTSLSALVGFLVGAGIGGQLARRFHVHRGKMFLAAVTLELVLVVVAWMIVAFAAASHSGSAQLATAAILGTALGTQYAIARALAVTDMTTTVLTLTLTGLVADANKGFDPTALRSPWLSRQCFPARCWAHISCYMFLLRPAWPHRQNYRS